jgi:acetylornithine/N-succinyldiaminopimelate aminotransferase
MTDPIMHTYGRMDVAFVSGDGAWLTDDKGNRYLDALAGIAVVALGHAHPGVTSAVAEQAGKLIHTSNLYEIPRQRDLAADLTRISGMDCAFFCNSGAEANEAAIKIARLYGQNKGIASPTIIVADQSFHGRTMATLTATGNRKVQAGFEPLVEGFVRAPFDDIGAIQNIADNSANIVAILVEPIQGEAGIHIPADDYLSELRRICDEKNWLLMLDEVQTGNARTGTYFSYMQSGVLPDVVTTAKGLGNGLPIGACLARGIAGETLKPGNHATTFGGNPLVCAAALKVIETIESENLCERVQQVGERMLNNFRARLGKLNNVKDIRGRGLMIAVELDEPCTDLVQKALERRLLINVAADKVIRLVPPLIISDEEADQICDMVSTLVEEI